MRLEARKLSKRFGKTKVLNQADFHLQSGELIGLMGKNGAGKTTLLRLLAGLIRADEGGFWLDGQPWQPSKNENRHAIAMLAHLPWLYENLSATENLRFYADLYQCDVSAQAMETLLTRVGLLANAKQVVRGFSRGMKQRLAIARCLLHQPKILLMDEPFTGLDENGSQMLRDVLIEEQAKGHIILASTHDLSQILPIADHFLRVDEGKVLLEAKEDHLVKAEGWGA